LLLAARAAGHRGVEHRLAAAIIEFIHTATLLHDDVVDESGLRRGRRSANALFGNAASVLVGDFLYSRSFQMMVELGRAEVMAVLAETTNRIAEGEVMQLMHVHNPEVDEAAYRRVIERKTAVLFEAAGRLGAILADAAPAAADALARYGRELGFAFQLADDWLDYVADADALGKNLGDDLAEGKATLPLIRALATVDAEERETLRRALIDGDVSALPEVKRIIEHSGALDYARAAAEAHANAALAALNALPDSPEREALAAVARYAIERDR
jgi:octaprenyl-diphosphate synthase